MMATADITFHYPPELFNLLVDTIPLLNRSKKDVVLFFQGAGVPTAMLQDIRQQLREDASKVNKFGITRSVLERLNSRGEAALQQHREVLRRVVEFANFDTCWSEDQLKAKGLVAAIRDVVNQKDAFTRMYQAQEDERLARLAEVERVNQARKEKAAKLEAAKLEFYALFAGSLTPQQRGKKLETALNNVFRAYAILVREAFHLVGEPGEGIVEQIDGVVELRNDIYFVEMKWYKDPVGVPEISQHMVRLMGRAEGRGIFISGSEFTGPAVQTCRELLPVKLMALCHLQEIALVLEQARDLETFLIEKVRAAEIHKNPYFRPLAEGTLTG